MNIDDQLPGEQGSNEQQLGRGTYGNVYRRKIDGKYVAVKTYGKNPDYNELEIMNNYFHPNILSALSVITEPKIFIVSELGSALVPSEKSIIDLCQGLHFLHSRGVLHLDLKPGNTIQVGDDAKLIDFGSTIISTPERIKKGFWIDYASGTRNYIPPERYSEIEFRNNFRVSTRSDVFGLGWTLLTMFSGFLSGNVDLYQQLAVKRNERIDINNHYQDSFYFHTLYTKNEHNRLRLINLYLPDSLPNKAKYVNVIYRMLAFEEKDRPEMSEVLEMLGVYPIPGEIKVNVGTLATDVKVDSNVRSNFSRHIRGIFEFSSIDISYMFQVVDVAARCSDFPESLSAIFNSSRKYDGYNGRFTLDDGTIDYIHGFTKPFPEIYPRLGFSVASCNILYRMSPNIDCLIDLYHQLVTGKLIYGQVDWFELQTLNKQKYPEKSKIMSCEEFFESYNRRYNT